MDTDDLERLTLLERAQLLHDATLRRHGDMLNRLEEARVQHAARLTAPSRPRRPPGTPAGALYCPGRGPPRAAGRPDRAAGGAGRTPRSA
jgi:hypothetical protein